MRSVLEAVATRAEIDLGALRQNVREVQRLAGGVPLMAAVKADAYGHGADLVVPVLRAEGVAAFGVASVQEAVLLRELGVRERVLVFGELVREALPACLRHDIEVTLGSAAAVEEAIAADLALRVHLKVDTGMRRLGVLPAEVGAAAARLRRAPKLTLASVWTHLATADEADPSFSRRQIALFDEVRAAEGLADIPHHVANSGGLVQLREAVRGRSWVRPGGLLYGIPSSRVLASRAEVRPVMRLVSRVVRVEQVARGDTVSYGRTWRAEAPTLVATVAAGYADGLPRQLSNRGSVTIRGGTYPIAGTVCMDMLMADLGAPEGPGAAVRRGDEAVIFGHGGPTALEQAERAGTISYALTSALTGRVPRVPRS